MKYFYDTEFIEDGKTIDLISIGVVAEDGREFYMCSLDFDEDKASEWVKENVFPHLPERPPRLGVEIYPGYLKSLGSTAYAFPFPEPWGSRGTIATALRRFVGDDKPEWWGYYSAYDHVALCQLFGTMMDLPKGWPFYTRDLKQLCDSLGNPRLPEQGKGEHNALADARWNKRAWEFLQSVKAEGAA
jgi:hypothetical protein